MPIYAYRCGACGHSQDVLQKISDPVLTTCPACGAEALAKQVTAAGFQLKGSGWYVTDFRGGNTAQPEGAKNEGAKNEGAKNEGAGSEPASSAPAKTEAKSDAKSDAASPAPAPSPTPAAPAAGG